MYKLLIVDDEPHIRAGLRRIIEWENYGIDTPPETAANGLQAYHIIESQRPDLVLVDINMPDMNGLELIERCSELHMTPKFIILTGYNDFKYVQKAIKLGASDYLLKPIDQEELSCAVSTCIKQLDSEHAHQQLFNESLPALRNELLLRLLNDQIDASEFQQKSSVAGVSLKSGSFSVGLLRLSCDKADDSSFYLSAMQLCEKILSAVCPCYIVSNGRGNLIAVFNNTTHVPEFCLLDQLSRCADAISEKPGGSAFYVLGKEVQDIRELSAAYNDCILNMEKALVLGGNIPGQLPESVTAGSAIDYSDFLVCLDSGESDKMRQYLLKCCSRFLSDENDQKIFKYYLIDLVTYVLNHRYINSYFSPEVEERKKTAFSIIQHTDSIENLAEKLVLFFLALPRDILLSATECEYPSLIQKVLKNIRKNYADSNLSLKTIAARMDVNPAYLGREFSLATGTYFNDYLNGIRISKAIELLATTDLKATKIAESVGFSNSSYFFTIFKKITGQSPNSYRSPNA